MSRCVTRLRERKTYVGVKTAEKFWRSGEPFDIRQRDAELIV